MADSKELLAKSSAFHGRPCPDLALGIRMAELGARSVGLGQPEGRGTLVVYVETDRCIVDALQVATGCTAGGRSLKLVDYGKAAATFVNTGSGSAVRVRVKGEVREKAIRHSISEGLLSPHERLEPNSARDTEVLTKAYLEMPESALFEVERVFLDVPLNERPGAPVRFVRCSRCGEEVFDFKETIERGYYLCEACASRRYYAPLKKTDISRSFRRRRAEA